MSRKTTTIPLIILVLLIGELVSYGYVVEGQPIGLKPAYANSSIESPQNSYYNVSEIQLSFTVLTNSFYHGISNYSDSHCFIILDSKSYEYYGLTEAGRRVITNDSSYNPYTEFTLVGNTTISNLTTGTHSVEIEYGFYYAWPDKNYQIEFIVLSTTSASFSINSDITSNTQPSILLPTPYPYPTVSIPPIPTTTIKPPPTRLVSPSPTVPEVPFSLVLIFIIVTIVTFTAVLCKKLASKQSFL